jgi:chitinase
MQSNGTYLTRVLLIGGEADGGNQPYVYNATSQVMVSFDDAKSFKTKGEFIKNFGLRGWAMWEAAGDYHDTLIDSIREGSGC